MELFDGRTKSGVALFALCIAGCAPLSGALWHGIKAPPHHVEGANPFVSGKELTAGSVPQNFLQYRCQPERERTTYTLTVTPREVCIVLREGVMRPTGTGGPVPVSLVPMFFDVDGLRSASFELNPQGVASPLHRCESPDQPEYTEWVHEYKGCAVNDSLVTAESKNVALRDSNSIFASFGFPSASGAANAVAKASTPTAKTAPSSEAWRGVVLEARSAPEPSKNAKLAKVSRTASTKLKSFSEHDAESATAELKPGMDWDEAAKRMIAKLGEPAFSITPSRLGELHAEEQWWWIADLPSKNECVSTAISRHGPKLAGFEQVGTYAKKGDDMHLSEDIAQGRAGTLHVCEGLVSEKSK